MNIAIETVNRWGEWFASFSFGMLLQSSVLIVILASLDWLLRNKARAIVRHSLWMLLLLKLVLPVNLSLPTSVIEVSPILAYSPLESAAPAEAVASVASPAPAAPLVDRPVPNSEASGSTMPISSNAAPLRTESNATLSPFGWALLGWLVPSTLLFVAVIWKSVRVSRFVRTCAPAPRELAQILGSCLEQLRIRRNVELRVSDENLTPALCGIVRPCILLPRSLTVTLEANELRAVLLHELVHLKRGDLLVNLAQTILQIVYFFHPLLWLANSRIRTLREQAVDEAVLVAMGSEAEMYPATLVNVAKFTLHGRAISFGMVGVMESRSAFSSRIRRMLARPFPTSARLGVTSIAAMVVFAVCVLPMAGREGAAEKLDEPAAGLRFDSEPAASPSNSTNSFVAAIRAKSLQQLFAEYEVYAELRKRSQGSIAAEIASRTNAVEFLTAKLRKDFSRPDTAEAIQGRQKAAHLIGKFGPQGESAVPLLMECFEDEEEVRSAAARALGEIGPGAKMAIPILQEELHFQNNSAGSSLSKIAPHSEEVLNSLIEAVLDRSKSEDFRQQVIFALRSMTIRTPAYSAAFEKLAQEPEGMIKDAALQAKGVSVTPRFVSTANPEENYKNEELPAVIERIRADPEDYEAVNALRRFGTNAISALPTLIELLESKNARFPGNVVIAICAMGPSASNAVPALLRCLDDDDQSVVHNALNGFGRIGPSAIAAKSRLIEFLEDPFPMLRWQAADSLRRVDPSELNRCLPILLEPIKTGRASEYQVRMLAELGEHGKPYIPKLRQMLAGAEELRIGAANALLVLDPSATSEVVRAMIRTLEDETAMNPQLAAVVLGKVGPSAREALPSLRRLAAHENAWRAKPAQDAINQIEQKPL